MNKNTHPEFVGIPKLLNLHAETLQMFRFWAKDHAWDQFHHHHYDWWMFPIDERSTSYDYAYSVYDAEVQELRTRGFVEDLAEGLDLLAWSWGWDITEAQPLKTLETDQGWSNWPIRLYKATRSAQLFGES